MACRKPLSSFFIDIFPLKSTFYACIAVDSPSCSLLQDMQTVTPEEAAERIQQAEATAGLVSFVKVVSEHDSPRMQLLLLQDLETVTPEEAAERIQQAEAMAKLAAHERIQVERRNLPMYKFRTDLMKAIAEYQIIIVVAETGSGKTTQVRRPVVLTSVRK